MDFKVYNKYNINYLYYLNSKKEYKNMERSKVYFTDFRTKLGEGLPSS